MTRAKHKSLYGKADRVLRSIEESEMISRVVLGRSRGKSHGQPDGTVKVQNDEQAGIRILIYSSKGITEAYVYCKAENRDQVKALIEEKNS